MSSNFLLFGMAYYQVLTLYDAVTKVQMGEAPDPHGYTRAVGTRAHEEC